MARPKMTDEQKAQAAQQRITAQLAQLTQLTQPAEAVMVADVADMPTLAAYIAANERDGIVLTRVTYPLAPPHVFPGVYSGIVVADGPLSCTWSDGSTQDS
jgi:hypothetical protein